MKFVLIGNPIFGKPKKNEYFQVKSTILNTLTSIDLKENRKGKRMIRPSKTTWAVEKF